MNIITWFIKKYLIRKVYNYIKYNKNICLSVDMDLKSTLKGKNRIEMNCNIRNSEIGFGTYIGWECDILNTIIGRYCAIAPRLKIVIGKHPLNSFVSIHPCFYSTRAQAGFTYVKQNIFKEFEYIDKNRKVSVQIGNDVWIGSDVIILGGVKIGNGAIIAAGAVVTKDIPEFEVWGGVPAKKIKDRFEEKIKNELMKIKWWDKEEKWIKERVELFCNIEKFLESAKYRSDIDE